MHVENEFVEIVAPDDREFEEIVEEYVEEILMREEVLEPPTIDIADNTPAQGKPWCITLIFYNHYMYICDVHLRYWIFMETTCIDISVL
jgi:hypothetical protein